MVTTNPKQTAVRQAQQRVVLRNVNVPFDGTTRIWNGYGPNASIVFPTPLNRGVYDLTVDLSGTVLYATRKGDA